MSATSDRDAPIRIVVVNQDDQVRRHLIDRLSAQPGIQVVAHTAGIAAAIAEIARHGPDVALIDTDLSDGTGLELAQRLRQMGTTTRSILHAASPVDPHLLTESEAAIVLKRLLGDDLVNAIHRAADTLRGRTAG